MNEHYAALPRLLLTRSRDREAYRISVTLFQIFDLNSRHVRDASPANLDSERGWKILREWCNVYSHVYVYRGNMVNYVDRVCVVFRLIPPIDTDVQLTTKTRIHVSRRWRNCCFIPRISRSASRTRQIVYHDGIACMRKFRTCRFQLGLSRKSRILVHENEYIACIICA